MTRFTPQPKVLVLIFCCCCCFCLGLVYFFVFVCLFIFTVFFFSVGGGARGGQQLKLSGYPLAIPREPAPFAENGGKIAETDVRRP